MATFKNKPTKVPQLHVIPTEVSPAVRQWMLDIQEALEIRLGRRGDQRDRAVTLRELIESGLAKDLTNRPYDPNADTSTDFVGNIDYRGPEDLLVPPVPSGLNATGAFTTIKLTWNAGYSVYGNHSYTKVFRHSSDTVGDSVEIAAPGKYHGGYLDEVGYAQTYYYWIRHVSVAGVEGPYSDSVTATTVQDIGATMAALTESLADLPGYTTLTGLITDGALVIRSASAPTQRVDSSALRVNDIWLDTDDDQIYVRNAANNAWIKARDGTIKTDIDALIVSLNSSNSESDTTLTAAISNERLVRIEQEGLKATAIELGVVEATAEAKVKTFVHGSASNLPAATTVGDILIRTDENNKMYRATAADNSHWAPVSSPGVVYTDDDPPSGASTGDLWFDTNSTPDNKQHRWTGSAWEEVRDVTTNAGVIEVKTAVVDGTSARSGYAISVNANDAVAGMYIMANSSGALQDEDATSIIFEADQLAIRSSSAGDENADGGSGNKYTPFIVRTTAGTVNGLAVPAGVYIKDGWIENGAITTAKIHTLVADKIDAGIIDGYSVSGVSISGDTINAGQIRAERLGVGNINASISMSSPVITGGNITGQTITAGTLNVANGAQSNTIGKIEGNKGASVWMPNNFSGSGDTPGSNYATFYADTFGSGQNPYHLATSFNPDFWLPIISNGGATAGIQIVVPNLKASVTALSITNAGSGYATDGSLVISFSGGGGTGAAAYAVVAGGAIAKAYLTSGAVSSIAMANSGVGYSSAPTVAFSGGGGSGAAGTAVISNTVVTSITITNAGSGYTSAPTIAFSGGGTGTVTETHITNPGSNYTSAPSVVFSSGAAAATATISGGVVSQANNTADRITYFIEWNANLSGSFDGDESMWTVCSISTADAWNTNSNWWMTAGGDAVNDSNSGAGAMWSGHGSFTVDLDINDTYYLWVFGFQHNTMPNTVNGTRRYSCAVKWFAMYK